MSNQTITHEMLVEHVKALLDCREATERTCEDAYDFTFKSGIHHDHWEALIELTGWNPNSEADTAVKFDQLAHGSLLYGDQWAPLDSDYWLAVPATHLGTQVNDWGGFKFKRPRVSNLQEIEV
jgi:hypothetical protein